MNAGCDNRGMFTGIITGLGRIVDVHALGSDPAHGKRLTIQAPPAYLDDALLGDSIALNGACMTATSVDGARFTVDVSGESLSKTAGLDGMGDVNIETSMALGDKLGGHLVAGHVDGVGEVVGRGRQRTLRHPQLARLQRFVEAV